MLYPIFDLLRKKLESIPELKTVQWYNAQYEGVIYASPAVFVEFPQELVMKEANTPYNNTSLNIRIHVVSASLPGQDNSIPDEQVIAHESMAHEVLNRLKGIQLNTMKSDTTSLVHCGWQHYHKYKGWMITFLDFKAEMYIEF